MRNNNLLIALAVVAVIIIITAVVLVVQFTSGARYTKYPNHHLFYGRAHHGADRQLDDGLVYYLGSHPTWNECQDACEARGDCVAYTWHEAGGFTGANEKWGGQCHGTAELAAIRHRDVETPHHSGIVASYKMPDATA